MAPIVRREEECFTFYNISIDRNNSASAGTNNYTDEDKHALLYIVCTLLFYSIGIMVGIVSYIKREKQDIEEDRLFHEFLSFVKGKTDAQQYRQIKVQETVDRLEELEQAKTLSSNCLPSDSDKGRNKTGINSVERQSLLTFANNSLLRAPIVAMSSVANSLVNMGEDNDGDGNVSDNSEPFADRRLSEVVAEMLDDTDIHHGESVHPEDTNVFENDHFQTAFIDYNREPRNKELRRQVMHSIDESDLEDVCGEQVEAPEGLQKPANPDGPSQCRSEPNILCTNELSVNEHHINTTIGKSIETVFGVKSPSKSSKKVSACHDGDKAMSEPDSENITENSPDSKYRWSVTSV